MYKLCGKIMAPHGIKGALKVNNYSDFDRFKVGSYVYYKKDDNYNALEIVKVSPYKTNSLLVTFKNYEDINLTTNLLGLDLYAIPKEGELGLDEYYYDDLIGKDIYNQDNVKRGSVIDIKVYPQGEMLVVLVDGKRKMIPFRKEFVVSVSDVIRINEIEGLLWE